MNEGTKADTIGGRIHERLADMGKTSTWLAGQIGVKEKTVDRWADGINPQSATIAPVAACLKRSVSWVLLGREDPAIERWIEEGRRDGIPADEMLDAMIGRGNVVREADHALSEPRDTTNAEPSLPRPVPTEGAPAPAPAPEPVSEEPAEPPAGGRAVPPRSADRERQRPGGAGGPRGRERKDQPKPRPRQNPDEDQPA